MLMKKYKNLLKVTALCVLVFSVHTSAENILDIYNEALENDPTFKAAEYSYLADKEIKVQGRASLLPSVSISGNTNWNEYYQNKELTQNYNSFSSSASITQPLFRLDNWFNYKQSRSLTDAAEADLSLIHI